MERRITTTLVVHFVEAQYLLQYSNPHRGHHSFFCQYHFTFTPPVMFEIWSFQSTGRRLSDSCREFFLPTIPHILLPRRCELIMMLPPSSFSIMKFAIHEGWRECVFQHRLLLSLYLLKMLHYLCNI